MTLEQIKELIAKNPTTHVYVRYISSNLDSKGKIFTARIFRPLRVHPNGTISLEVNGYIYYVHPKKIIGLGSEDELVEPYNGWFGSSNWD